MVSISVGTSKISCEMCAFCRCSPLTQVCMRMSVGASSRLVIQGPSGQKPSSDLPRNHCAWFFCRSRAVTSFRATKPQTCCMASALLTLRQVVPMTTPISPS